MMGMPDKRRFAVTGEGVLYIKVSSMMAIKKRGKKVKQLTGGGVGWVEEGAGGGGGAFDGERGGR
jgi:hypothetical protein